jgi:hypothetical protein
MKFYLVHKHGKKLISKLIMLITRSWASHTAILVELNGEAFIYEADDNSVQKLYYPNWAKDFKIELQIIDLTEKQKYDLLKLMESQLGKGYDFKATLIDQLIYQLRGKWLGHTGSFATDKFYCSEFTSYCLNEILGIYPNWNTISPGYLHKEERFKTVYKGKAKDFI